MTLYAAARTNADTQKLLAIYQRRILSNLTHALRQISPQPGADAETIAALIDGLYLRAALSDKGSADAALKSAISTLDLLSGAKQ